MSINEKIINIINIYKNRVNKFTNEEGQIIIKVEYENNIIREIEEQTLLNSLTFNRVEDAINKYEYKNFKFTIKGVIIRPDCKKIPSFYKGYIKYLGNDDAIYDILVSIINIFPYSFIGEDGMGVYYDGDGNITINFSLLKNIGKRREYNYSIAEHIYNENTTFKTKEYVYEQLTKIVEKVLDLRN